MSKKRMALNKEEMVLLAQAARDQEWWFMRCVLDGNGGRLRHEGAALAIEYLLRQAETHEWLGQLEAKDFATSNENGGGQ
jgi:hypothetical protein